MIFDKILNTVAYKRREITRWNDTPYMVRWFLIPKMWFLPAVFIHKFLRSDEDELHDHPWAFITVILWGGYNEVTPGPDWINGIGTTVSKWRGPGSILYRPAKWKHSVRIEQEAYTLFIHFGRERKWGFYCKGFWRQHDEHFSVAEKNEGNGCS